jgi:nicotinate-nucleotide adenylyltransferase
MRIGIIGGSFNPIHIAHLIIADRFCDQMELDRCIFVPAAQSPFKINDTSLASGEHRASMVQLATEQHPKFEVSDIEICRGGVSFTIDTVRAIQKQYPDASVSLLIGSDQAIEFVRWKEWESICREAQLCIVRRPFLLTPEMEERITDMLSIDGASPVWITAPLLEISSTEIRQRVAAGRSINYLTVKAVRDYIFAAGLYT